jgi:hypothetical protein
MTKAAELAKMGEVLTNSQIGGRRNIVINGAMQVAQRGTSDTGVGASNGVFPCVDRMKIMAGTTAGRATVSQAADVHDGFANALKFDCTTADTSIAADEFFILRTLFEGQDLQQIKKGTSDAEKLTLSFYVKGNASATYTCELEDRDNSRYNSQEFSVTTSWTRVVKTFLADTTGSFGDDNAESLAINFWLHSGSTYTGGTHTDNVWHTTNNQRVGDNQTSIFDSTDREFFITGIQLEIGEQATPFEHRSFGEELALCQRYCFAIDGAGLAGSDVIASGHCRANNAAYVLLHFPVPMRVKATSITVNTVGHFGMVTYGVINLACTTVALQTATPRVASINLVGSTTSLTVGFGCFMYHINDDGLIVFEGAEL